MFVWGWGSVCPCPTLSFQHFHALSSHVVDVSVTLGIELVRVHELYSSLDLMEGFEQLLAANLDVKGEG